MPNNPLVHYKPGVTLDTVIKIEMAAADALILMAWIANIDQEGALDGVRHIAYDIIARQISEQCYDAASLKAAQAHYGEDNEQRQPIVVQIPMPGSAMPPQCNTCGRQAGNPFRLPCSDCPDA